MTEPDDPTRPIQPHPREPVMRERVVEDDPERAALRDSIRSLRTALWLVALLAAVALGVAAYALLAEDDEDNGRTPASASRVAAIDDKVDELENRLDERATKGQVENVRKDLDDLEERLGDVSKTAQDSGGDDDAQQAVDDVKGDVQQLEDRVNDLEQQAQDDTTSP